MSIPEIVRLSIARTKNARAMQQLHPVAFNVLLTLALLFYSPLILFNYVRYRQWRIKARIVDGRRNPQ